MVRGSRVNGIAGSMNYPGVAPPPTAPQVPSFLSSVQSAPQGYGRQSASNADVYRDDLGISYGRGTGTTIGGAPLSGAMTLAAVY